MGKKSSRNGGDKAKATAAFVLKVPMHCRCDGCADKIRAGVKDLTLNHGVEALDQSALWTKGELTVVSVEDPEKLRRRLHKTTGKSVGLSLLPKPQAADKAATEKEAAAAMQDLLRRLALQQGQYGQPGTAWANQALPGGWSTLQQPGGGYGYPPWAAVQVAQPEAYHPSYPSAYPAAAATGGAWGAYAYPPAAQMDHGAYGGGWHGHGPY